MRNCKICDESPYGEKLHKGLCETCRAGVGDKRITPELIRAERARRARKVAA